MDEFWKAVGAVDWTKSSAVEYRIYYDVGTGQILDYTTESRAGDFITVDRETFARHRFEPRVKDGKLHWPAAGRNKLVPADSGTACHHNDITILWDDPHAQHWKTKTYED